MLIFRVTYSRLLDVHKDAEQQMAYGGLLLPVAEQLTRPLLPAEPCRLELTLPSGAVFATDAVALQVVGPAVALGLPPDMHTAAALRELLGKERSPARLSDEPPRHEVRDASDATPAKATPARPGTLAQQLVQMSSAEKIQMALHGDLDERTALLRDRNKTLHPYVLRNPGFTPEEALSVAKNAGSSVELLEIVASRKEWTSRPTIAIALVRNPKTPPGIALRALDSVGPMDLRQLAKGEGAPTHIVAAARKKVLR